MIIALLLASVGVESTDTSSVVVPSIVPAPVPDLTDDSIDDLARRDGGARPDPLAPGAWLPQVGDGLDAVVGIRFGIGTDATDLVRSDPPYGAVVDLHGSVAHRGWFASVGWGFQIAGPDTQEPARQTFQAWEIAIDAGYDYAPRPGWRLVPRIGFRAQPERIGPTLDTEVGAMADVSAVHTARFSATTRLESTLQVVGRYSPGEFDPASDLRLRRSTCFLWGERFLDCALAFSVGPGTAAVQGTLRATHERWSAALWGGWFVAGGETVNQSDVIIEPEASEDGDWMWLGLQVSIAATDDLRVGVSGLTGGRFRDSFSQSRVPLFSSDLARTTVVFHAVARM